MIRLALALAFAFALTSFSSVDAFAATSFTAGERWFQKSSVGNCITREYKEAVLNKAYSQCRQRFSHTTCNASVNEARQLDHYTSQTGGQWNRWDREGNYSCHLLVTIFL